MAMALMLLCCGCTLNVLRPNGEPATNIPNPIVNVDSAEAFAGTGVSIDAPVDAGDVSYSIIDGTLAQVSFTYDSLEYIYRASASATDIDGIYYNKKAEYVLSVICDGFNVDATIYSAEGHGMLALWEHDGISYSLWHEGEVSDEALQAAVLGVMGRSFQGVQADSSASPIDFAESKQCEADLDGDGFAERISYETVSGEPMGMLDYCLLSITGADGNEHKAKLDAQWLDTALCYDYDADGRIEIFLSGDVMSDDYESWVLRFDGKELIAAESAIPAEPDTEAGGKDKNTEGVNASEPEAVTTLQPSFRGTITRVNDNSLIVTCIIDILGTRAGTTTFLPASDRFAFDKDPGTAWSFYFDASNEEDWQYIAIETSAEFPVRMDGTSEDATLPIGTRIGITEMNKNGEEYICRFITRSGEEGAITLTFSDKEDDWGYLINGVKEEDCFTQLRYAG